MPQFVASDQGIHCLLLIQHFLDPSTSSNLKLFKFMDKYGKVTIFRINTLDMIWCASWSVPVIYARIYKYVNRSAHEKITFFTNLLSKHAYLLVVTMFIYHKKNPIININNPWSTNHNCSRRHFDFFFFSKKMLIFHVNLLPDRQVTRNVKTSFLWKIKIKNVVCYLFCLAL